ncbi:hypothetical protein [Chitinimonas lacunae]|uniref:Citryl-CoA lyase n=1 Tax=Chitinimonas lacunae TaxID=1963018 RepID=A0ABV8MMC1_9NEIS
MKPGPQRLADAAGRLRTRMGAAFPGSHALFRGHDLHAELGQLDWMALYVFGITGRQPSPQQVELLHALWVYTSYPDARLWNNRVAELAGSCRSSAALALPAAMAVSDATVYGGQAGARALDFFLRTQAALEQGASLAVLVETERRRRHLSGYGRPINSHDERIPWLLALVERLGLEQGPHLRLAFAVEKLLVAERPQLKINYAAVYAAIMADLGFSVREYQAFRIPTFLAGMAPCYLEGLERAEGTFLPVACEAVHYEGVAIRRWENYDESH